jgi:hypothetical protein
MGRRREVPVTDMVAAMPFCQLNYDLTRDLPESTPVLTRDLPESTPVLTRDLPESTAVLTRDLPESTPVLTWDLPESTPVNQRCQTVVGLLGQKAVITPTL